MTKLFTVEKQTNGLFTVTMVDTTVLKDVALVQDTIPSPVPIPPTTPALLFHDDFSSPLAT